MSSASSPSSVLRLSVVPRAAEVIGRVTRQCRSSPSRVNTSCGRSWISTYRSPAGPPPGPTSPCPVRRMRMPSSTPAGTFTCSVRRDRTRPSPPHSRVGDDLADARAGRADPAGHDLAEEAALDALHLAAAPAGGARRRVGAGCGPGAGADGAQDGGVDGDVLRRPEDRLVELELDRDE